MIRKASLVVFPPNFKISAAPSVASILVKCLRAFPLGRFILLLSPVLGPLISALFAERSIRGQGPQHRAAPTLELLGERTLPKRDLVRAVLKRLPSGFFGKEGSAPVNYGLESSLPMELLALDRH